MTARDILFTIAGAALVALAWSWSSPECPREETDPAITAEIDALLAGPSERELICDRFFDAVMDQVGLEALDEQAARDTRPD